MYCSMGETAPLVKGAEGQRAPGTRSYGGAGHNVSLALDVAGIRSKQQADIAPAISKKSWRRSLGSAAVCAGVALAFALASSTFSASDQHSQQPGKKNGSWYRGMFELDAASATVGADDFTLVATNEYGEYDRGALALYGYDMLVEPYKETTITASLSPPDDSPLAAASTGSTSYKWQLVREDGESEVIDMADCTPDDVEESGSAVKVTLTGAGATYSLLVSRQQTVTSEGHDGSSIVTTVVLSEKQVVISCKYVRRELRDLTTADSTAFFSAMREFYTVELEEGREKYGEDFTNSAIMSGYHNSRNFCFHSGMHFLNAHASFDLWAERSLQMIDPTVALHYWDFTIDAATLGPNWGDSEIFSVNMFGSATGSPLNGYQLSEGWFADAKTIYDPDETFLADVIEPGHSIYGFIDATYNFQNVTKVTRTNSYCGLKGELEFATCNVIIGCFEDNDNINDWNVCMEDQVHAANHGMIGGAFNCNVDMAEFSQKHSEFDTGLLTFALEYVLVSNWPSNSLMGSYNDCDSYWTCTPGQSEPCGCTCTTDVDEWSDDQVYDMMERSMMVMAGRAHGAKYIYQDTSADLLVYGFLQDGEPLGYDKNLLIMRTLLTIACEPGALGAMSVGPSILDPVFWALHPIFEKATQILQLSPTYRDKYDFTWLGADCGSLSGGAIDETLPFTERVFGFGDGTDFLTNQEIIDLLSPANPKLSYAYDKFDTWGSCTDWNFEVSRA
eukprot:g2500.t1